MNITCDFREKGREADEGTRAVRMQKYCDGLGPNKSLPSAFEFLEFGDYLLQSDDLKNKVIWEYKTIDDFHNSLMNGTLFEEAYNQTAWVLRETNGYGYSFLIIEGDYEVFIRKQLNVLGVSPNNFQTHLKRSLAMYKGAIRRLRCACQVINCKTEEDCFKEIVLQSEKLLNPKNYGGSKRAFETGDIISFVLSGCAGVSNKTIDNIKTKYINLKSLKDLLELSKNDFKAVKLIGDKKAEDIYNWLHKGE